MPNDTQSDQQSIGTLNLKIPVERLRDMPVEHLDAFHDLMSSGKLPGAAPATRFGVPIVQPGPAQRAPSTLKRFAGGVGRVGKDIASPFTFMGSTIKGNVQTMQDVRRARADYMEAEAARARRPQETKEPTEFGTYLTGPEGQKIVTEYEKARHPGAKKPEQPPTPAEQAYQYEIKQGANPLEAYKQVYGKPAPELHDAFHEYMANPEDYSKFKEAMSQIQSKGGKNTGFMTMYAMYRLLQTAYQDNPALLPVVSDLFKNTLKNAGIDVPANFDLSKVPVDQPLSPETGQPIGTRMPSAPTGTTRTRGQWANALLSKTAEVRPRIQSLQAYTGPVSGRVMDFLLGDVGSTGDAKKDRQLSQLRNDMVAMESGYARMHLNSVRAMEEFKETARTRFKNGISAAAMQGFLDSLEETAKDYAAQIRGAGEEAPKGKPAAKPWEMNWGK